MVPDQYDTKKYYEIDRLKWEFQSLYPGAQILGESSNILLVHAGLNKFRPDQYPMYNKRSTILLLEFYGSILYSRIEPHVLVEEDLRLRTGYFKSITPSWLCPVSVSQEIRSRFPSVSWAQFVFQAANTPNVSQSQAAALAEYVRKIEDALDRLRLSNNRTRRFDFALEREIERLSSFRSFRDIDRQTRRIEHRIDSMVRDIERRGF